MASGWLEGYEHRPTENCGGYTNPNAADKHLLHTTESGWGSIEGVYNLFRGSTLDSPHFTIDPGNFRRMQHAEITRAACALRGSWQAPTNGAMVIQTEICGWAATTHEWNDNVLMFIAQHLVDARNGMQAILGHTYPLVCTVTFYGTDAGFTLATESAPQRLSPGAFQSYGGVLGHQHVHCVTPDTSILCSDLVWRPAGELLVGDEILGVDEESPDGSGRRLRNGTVTSSGRADVECYRITTQDRELICSADHPLMAYVASTTRGSRWAWKEAARLSAGDEIALTPEPWETDLSRDAGWLAGAFDCDGCLSGSEANGFFTLSFGQVDNEVLAKVDACLSDRGFQPKVVERGVREGTLSAQPFFDLRLVGGRWEIARALGSLRPERLLRKATEVNLLDGRHMGKLTERQQILSIEPVGIREVATIGTSIRTYIANGFVSHNSNDHWDPGKLNVPRILELANYIAGNNPNPPDGGLNMDAAEVKQIVKEALLESLPAGLLNGQWEKDTRALFGDTALKKPGDPKQYLIGYDRNGPFKVWIRDGDQKDVLVKAGIIRQALNFTELTDPGDIAWLDQLPEA